jgi:hypothetical protein
MKAFLDHLALLEFNTEFNILEHNRFHNSDGVATGTL